MLNSVFQYKYFVLKYQRSEKSKSFKQESRVLKSLTAFELECKSVVTICANCVAGLVFEYVFNRCTASDTSDCVDSSPAATATQWNLIKGTERKAQYVVKAKTYQKAVPVNLSLDGKKIFFKKKQAKIKELVCIIPTVLKIIFVSVIIGFKMCVIIICSVTYSYPTKLQVAIYINSSIKFRYMMCLWP